MDDDAQYEELVCQVAEKLDDVRRLQRFGEAFGYSREDASKIQARNAVDVVLDDLNIKRD